MQTAAKWAIGIGSVAVVGGGVWWVLRRQKAAATSTVPASQAPPHLTAAQLSWPAPQAYGTVIGPGAGNQPNGVYQLARTFTAPSAGTYTLQVFADDTAQIVLDGQVIGTVTFVQGTVTFKPALSAGAHTLVVIVANNGLGTAVRVPYQSGAPNPTGLVLSLTGPTGAVLIQAGSATGWHYSGYLPSLQVKTAAPWPKQ